MPTCCIKNCRTYTTKKPEGVSLHRFPKNDEIKIKWIEAIGRPNWHPTVSAVVCSQHFEEKYINRSGEAPRITDNGFPTLNLPSDKILLSTKPYVVKRSQHLKQEDTDTSVECPIIWKEEPPSVYSEVTIKTEELNPLSDHDYSQDNENSFEVTESSLNVEPRIRQQLDHNSFSQSYGQSTERSKSQKTGLVPVSDHDYSQDNGNSFEETESMFCVGPRLRQRQRQQLDHNSCSQSYGQSAERSKSEKTELASNKEIINLRRQLEKCKHRCKNLTRQVSTLRRCKYRQIKRIEKLKTIVRFFKEGKKYFMMDILQENNETSSGNCNIIDLDTQKIISPIKMKNYLRNEHNLFEK